MLKRKNKILGTNTPLEDTEYWNSVSEPVLEFIEHSNGISTSDVMIWGYRNNMPNLLLVNILAYLEMQDKIIYTDKVWVSR